MRTWFSTPTCKVTSLNPSQIIRAIQVKASQTNRVGVSNLGCSTKEETFRISQASTPVMDTSKVWVNLLAKLSSRTFHPTNHLKTWISNRTSKAYRINSLGTWTVGIRSWTLSHRVIYRTHKVCSLRSSKLRREMTDYSSQRAEIKSGGRLKSSLHRIIKRIFWRWIRSRGRVQALSSLTTRSLIQEMGREVQ